MEERFSVRWGIPLLDEGFTVVPNIVLDNLARLGLNHSESLLVIFLARYKFEAPNTQACPSLGSLAAKMGCSVRWVRKLIRRLEEKGLLIVTPREGDTSVYDFTPLARKCLEHSKTYAQVAQSCSDTIVQHESSAPPGTPVPPKKKK